MKIIVTSVFLCLLPLTAIAQNNTDKAKALFQTANEMYQAGKYEAAAQTYRQANELKPTYKLFFNIGQAESAAKRYGAALEAFEMYLAEGGDELGAARQTEVRKEIARLRDITGIVEVSGPDGMVIRIDGTVRGTYPTMRRFFIAAGGVHRVSGTIGEKSDEKDIRVLSGDTATLTLSPATVAVEAAGESIETDAEAGEINNSQETTNAPTKTSMDKLFIIGVSTAGVGAAAMVGGAIAGGLALNKNSLMNSKCTDRVCTDDMKSEEESRDRLGVINAVLLGVGGAAAATGVALIVVSKLKKREQNVTLVPTVDGFAVAGRF